MSERPTDTQCPCGKIFRQPQRAQGGGRHSIFCSKRCAAREWARANVKRRREAQNRWVTANPEKRKAAILKYESQPENKIAKQNAARRRLLARYGWSLDDFARQLARQHRRCATCLVPIDEKTARVDHCHRSNVVRGLLCDSCNWAIGHACDDPMTLRRMMAYLERDLTKKMVYLAGALKNPRVPVIGNALRAEGFDVMDEWCTPGEHADTNWQAYEKLRGRSYVEALRGRAATNVFMFDRAYLDLSDAVVLLMPAGKSAMLELGYALGCGKPAFIFLDGEDPDRYDVMPNFASLVIPEIDALVAALKAV